MNQGDIHWIEFPFSDFSAKKLRPAVILSNDKYNKYNKNANVLFAGIYGKKQPLSIEIANNDLVRKRMQKPSHISIQNLMSIHKSLIGSHVDTLRPQKLKEVLSAVRACL